MAKFVATSAASSADKPLCDPTSSTRIDFSFGNSIFLDTSLDM